MNISRNLGNILINTIQSNNTTSNNTSFTNITTSNLYVQNGITTANLNFTGVLSQNGIPYSSSQWTGTSSNIFFGSSGSVSVGIGTTNPSKTLDVNGDSKINNITTGNLNFTGVLSQNGVPYSSSQWTGTGSNIFFGSSGSVFVGIGTTNPSKSLDVIGDSKFTNITASNINFTGTLYQNGTPFSGGASDLTNITTNVAPSTNGSLDLGTTTKRWRNLYLNGNLISFANGLQIDTFNWSYLANYIIPPRVAASVDSVYLFDGPALGHSAFIRNGLVYTFGNNSSGQLGQGDTTNRLIPTLVSGISGAVQVACGDSFTIVLLGNGTLLSCGINGNGQLGDGTTNSRSTFGSVLNITTGISVSCGFNFALVLLAAGTVYGFGSDSNGQLGNGATNLTINSTPIAMTMPTVVTNDDLARFIDCGAYHSVVLLANGSCYVCGDNTYGQLAVDPTLLTNANTLGVVPAISNVVSAAAGHYHTILITYLGNVITFGRNQGGQLGIGSVSAYNYVPSTIITQGTSGSLGLSTLAAAGLQHTGVIKGDNTIVMFGSNTLGQLGLGQSVTQALTPTLLPGYGGYAISAGQNHTLIRTVPQTLTYTGLTNATIIGFGDNTYGQMGDNNLNIPVRYFPNNIFTNNVLKKLGGAPGTTSTVDIDGTLYNCGANNVGQCGYPIVGVSKRLKPVSRFTKRITAPGKSFDTFSSVLSNDGQVYSSGLNSSGQLGNGTNVNSDSYTLATGTLATSTIVAISGGGNNTIVLSSTGRVHIWGYNNEGQLGNNTTTQSNIPIIINTFGSLRTAKISKIIYGPYLHAIALSSTGQVHTWGYNNLGQLGNNTTTQSLIPINVSSFGSLTGVTISAIAAGFYHSVALSSTGQVHTWGSNGNGQLGNNTVTQSNIPINISSFGSLSGQTIVAIAGGEAHTVVLSSTGQVHSWGYNSNGQLGNNTTTQSNIPINVSSFGSLSGVTIVAIACGARYTVALSSTGQVHVWGYNSNGQLGNNTTTDSNIPINVSSFGTLSGVTISSISSSGTHTVALSSTGIVHTWGNNGSGQLGNNTTTQSLVPINISSFGSLTDTLGRSVVAVASSGDSTIALDTLGKVHSWGSNAQGELGDTSTNSIYFPQNISSFGTLAGVGYRAIATGEFHSALISNSGQVYTWGLNTNGQLGNNTTTQSLVPVNVSSFGSLVGKTIIAIECGRNHTVALDNTGIVHTWGLNTNGQLGNNTTTQSLVPINVSTFGSLSGVTITSIACGTSHTIALSSTGIVHTWGYNGSGQLGNNTTTQSLVPINISSFGSLSGVTIIKINSGGEHTIALSTTGIVHTWGNNASGQLGNNNAGTNSSIPINVSSFGTLSGQTIASISVGSAHTIALSISGIVHTWGFNGTGQLGNNTTTNSSIPINISSFGTLSGISIISITNGGYFSIALSSTGTIHTWGDNTYGQLGNNTTAQSLIPINVSTFGTLSGQTIVAIAGSHVSTGTAELTLALSNTGTLHAWGRNNNGQLGNNSTTNSSVPINNISFTGITSVPVVITSISSGLYTCNALDSEGKIHTWGYNNYGTLGNYNSVFSINYPIYCVKGSLVGITITAISSMNYTTIALDSTGKVHTWGFGTSGQIGNGANLTVRYPTNISTFGSFSGKTIVAIAAGYYHGMALDSTGQVHTWGHNNVGKLGNNTTTDSNIPINVSTFGSLSGKTISSIFAVGDNSFALDSTGQIHGWGSNVSGQLGDGTTTQSNIPITISLTTRDTHTQVLSKGLGYHKLFTNALNSGNLTTLYAAGLNGNRQIGDNTTTTRNNIVSVNTFGSNIVSTANSEFHSAAVLANGTVYMWGKNNFGQCGSNSGGADIATPTLLSGISTAVQVACGVDFTIIRLVDYTLLSFGNNAVGQLGVDPTGVASRFTPTLMTTPTSIVDISSGGQSNLAIDNVGNCYSWGDNTYGKLGQTSGASYVYTPTQIVSSTLDNAKTVAISVGLNHSVVVCDNYNVYSCGRNLNGQLGIVTNFGTSTANTSFALVSLAPITTKPVSVACGDAHTIIQLANNTVLFFGDNSNGQCPSGGTVRWTPSLLGNQYDVTSIKAGKKTSYLETDGTSQGITGPQIITYGNDRVFGRPAQISGGLSHTSVIDSSFIVNTWGDNFYGQLGNNTVTQSLVPVNVSSFGSLSGQTIVSVFSGVFHTIAFSSTGQVHTWGRNDFGQLGNNTTTQSNVPINVSSFGSLSGQTIVSIASGGQHNIVLSSTGQVHAWGFNSDGQLGNNTTTQSNIPINVSSFGSLSGQTIVSICSASGNFTIALSSTGQVHTWGYNGTGALGNNTTTQSNIPINVSSFGSLSGVTIVAIAASQNHTLALDSTGVAHTWGSNANGQLGNNTTTQSNVPINVSLFGSLSGQTITAIACGSNHTIALSSTGQVHTWGSNGRGQLGNNTTTRSNIPINVSSFGSLSGITIVAIAAGASHTIALSSTGIIHTWGNNDNGQLGNNSTTQSNVPIAVSTSYIPANTLPVFQNFTGQHRCFVNGINPSELSNYEGLIVSSNLSKYKTLTGNNKITINESLPVVSLSNKQADKSVFGVISMSTDKSDITQEVIRKYRESGDTRVEINSIGEGSIWVIDSGGIIESGDYICSSNIPGYGMKQTDDIQRNYTVAKATMDCDFQGLLIQDTKIKVDSYGNNVLDSQGDIIFEPIVNTSVNENGEIVETIQMRNFYEIRFVNNLGKIITESEYESGLSGGGVYKAVFIGCTYHCG